MRHYRIYKIPLICYFVLTLVFNFDILSTTDKVIYLKFNCRKGGESEELKMTKDEVMEIIENSDVYDLVAAYSEYMTEELNDPDGALYAVDEMDEILYGLSYYDVINKVFYGDYSPTAEFFTFDGYGNLESVQDRDVVDFIACRLDDEELAELAELAEMR